MITFFMSPRPSLRGGFNFGATNGSGQVAEITGNWGLIDRDTPMEVRTRADYVNGKTWELVFSDEFNVDGRSFYPGDDPYWEAVDLHYWATNNKEWYDPAAITTKDGSLEITLSQKPNHDLNYTGGIISDITDPEEIRQIYVFLREALRLVAYERPFRGPLRLCWGNWPVWPQ